MEKNRKIYTITFSGYFQLKTDGNPKIYEISRISDLRG